MKNDLAIFEGYQIRRHYDEKAETWWFSVMDIIRVLTQQSDYQAVRKYWNKLKERLTKEGSQSVTNCHQLKKLKPLKTKNLRDHMSEAELIFTALAELSTRQIAESVDATGMVENKVAAKTGGRIAKKARLELEAKTKRKVVTGENYLLPPQPARQIK